MPGQGSSRPCRRDAVGGSVARKRHRARPRRWRGDALLAGPCCLIDAPLHLDVSSSGQPKKLETARNGTFLPLLLQDLNGSSRQKPTLGKFHARPTRRVSEHLTPRFIDQNCGSAPIRTLRQPIFRYITAISIVRCGVPFLTPIHKCRPLVREPSLHARIGNPITAVQKPLDPFQTSAIRSCEVIGAGKTRAACGETGEILMPTPLLQNWPVLP